MAKIAEIAQDDLDPWDLARLRQIAVEVKAKGNSWLFTVYSDRAVERFQAILGKPICFQEQVK
jgi:hypothetical protein